MPRPPPPLPVGSIIASASPCSSRECASASRPASASPCTRSMAVRRAICCIAPTRPCTRPSAIGSSLPSTIPSWRRRWGRMWYCGTSWSERSNRASWYCTISPKIDVRTLQPVGLEALVHWQHPDYGLLPPDKFIPLAESTDLIQPLTDWVLNAAIRQQRSWLESGYDLAIAVNLSAKSLRDPQLANRFRAICARWGAQPNRTIFEITENSVIGDPKSAARVLRRLAKMGCKVSLDDFGTGYSSLILLQTLPISELKINPWFVASMSTDRNASVIVRTMVNLAHTLGMRVVAEGWRTEQPSRGLPSLAATRFRATCLGDRWPRTTWKDHCSIARGQSARAMRQTGAGPGLPRSSPRASYARPRASIADLRR